MTDPTTLLTRLLALAELAVDEALQGDPEGLPLSDPEDRHIWRELQELKPLVQQALAQHEPVGPTVMEIIAMADEIEEEGLGQVDLVRHALTRWGRPAIEPVPTPEPGVADHITDDEGHRWDRTMDAALWAKAFCLICPEMASREDVMIGWFANAIMAGCDHQAWKMDAERKPVPVAERLPEPGVKVLAHYFNSHGKSRTVCARWIPARFESRDPETDDLLEYDEDSDTFYWPEGWYEEIENWDEYGSVKINEGEVTHWQPLPHWALPVPTTRSEEI